MKQAAPNVYHFLQLEAFKRLVLISNLVEPIFKSTITTELNHHKKLVYAKSIQVYTEFNKIINNVT
jgi:hypothetical protein